MKNLFVLSFWFSLWSLALVSEQLPNSISPERKTAVKTSPLRGSWLLMERAGEQLPVGMHVVMIVTETYAAYTGYDRVSKKFYYTGGGPYRIDNNRFILTYEFNTQDSIQVGQALTRDYVVKGKRLALQTPQGEEIWERMDNPSASEALAGVWRITEREQDGKMNTMPKGARKTIKILSGTRFQWAAINPETHQLFGTGGGIYTLKNGKYTETIEFFPRDASRVGMSLTFDATVTDKRWQHQGKSTTGNPVNEVWEKQE